MRIKNRFWIFNRTKTDATTHLTIHLEEKRSHTIKNCLKVLIKLLIAEENYFLRDKQLHLLAVLSTAQEQLY
ncbi:hypothetical protein BZZ01_06150 [Nostocales cyanobacterium HT-58-2]|nr:hypothetical protein BZZ01_06150 [Nostocales cyanobacterium HT-58-2]